MANNLNIQNSKELKNKELSLWKRGKEDRKKYYEVKLKKSTTSIHDHRKNHSLD